MGDSLWKLGWVCKYFIILKIFHNGISTCSCSLHTFCKFFLCFWIKLATFSSIQVSLSLFKSSYTQNISNVNLSLFNKIFCKIQVTKFNMKVTCKYVLFNILRKVFFSIPNVFFYNKPFALKIIKLFKNIVFKVSWWRVIIHGNRGIFYPITSLEAQWDVL